MLKKFQGLKNLFLYSHLPKLRKFWRIGISSVIVSSTAITGLLYGVRHIGGIQQLELMVFDQMMRSRPAREVDTRLLVVNIDENDIKALNQWPLSDHIIAQLLAKLNHHHPAAIGLDIARNIPQGEGYDELVAQFRHPNVIAIMSKGNKEGDRIDPPPNLPEDQIGIVDLPTDADGFIRRTLLFTDRPSLAIQLLLTYIEAGCPNYQPRRIGICRNLDSSFNSQKQYQLNGILLPSLNSDSGAYQTINSGGYQILIDYRGAETSLRRVSLTQVLQQQVNPDWIKDKIILIGAGAPSLKDLFLTPYSLTKDGTEMVPGVEVQAYITSHLLSVLLDGDRLFWFWTDWQEIFWILGWAIAGISLAWFIQEPLILIVGEIGLLVGLVGFSYFLFLQQGWIPIVAPALAFVLTSVTTLINRLYQFQQQQQMMMRLLGQQTSPEIATALWQGRDYLLQSGRLPWQKVVATILFSDIKNFSAIVEDESPERTMFWLNEYLNVMADIVQSHQGVVNKFIGDSVMAIFGVPIARQNDHEIAMDAQQSVDCALEMRSVLNELNQYFANQGFPKIEIRIGIFTGEVMVGSLGGKSRLEYGVIGDSVNIASRLESCEKDRQIDDCRILIAQETLDHLQDRYEVESWGGLYLKGKQQLVQVYRIVGAI